MMARAQRVARLEHAVGIRERSQVMLAALVRELSEEELERLAEGDSNSEFLETLVERDPRWLQALRGSPW